MTSTTLMKVFRRQNYREWPHGNHMARPVFIVGMPRSGTTLTEQILCSHPDVFGAGEISQLNVEFQNLLADVGLRRWRGLRPKDDYAAFAETLSEQILARFSKVSPEKWAKTAQSYLDFMQNLADHDLAFQHSNSLKLDWGVGERSHGLRS